MRTVLLTLGRLPKALDLVRGFAAAGCRVVVAEPFRRHLAGASRHVSRSVQVPAPREGKAAYLEALLRVVDQERVDLVVPVSEETMHVAHLHGRLPEGVGLFTMPPDEVLALHDKGGFTEAARRFGVAVPKTYALGSECARGMAALRDVVVKPRSSCSGRGVRVVRRGEALPEVGEPCVVQAFLPGAVVSSCTVAQGGRAMGTVLYRGTVMSGSVAVAFERVEDPALTAWVERFVAQAGGGAGWTGFISFDFIVGDAGEVHGIECNPRATSGLHFWEPGSIAQAVLTPGSAPVLRPERELQQFYSCLTEAQLALVSARGRRALRKLMATRDVSWDRADPWPFLGMVGTSWPIIREAVRQRATFGEVATLDIGWYEGGDIPPVRSAGPPPPGPLPQGEQCFSPPLAGGVGGGGRPR